MNESELKAIEKRLLEERTQAIDALRRLDDDAREADADGDLTKYPLHLADEGTDAMEREKELALLGAEGERLYAIDEALRRLYRTPDRFGLCERCGNEIEPERLQLVPWTRYCARCQQVVEQGEATE
ncbi:MAG: TraR/DksA family transcriptional regulator [Longimicrobiales bacterium]